MEFFKTTFLQKKSYAKLACSLSAYEGAHNFRLLKREKDNDVKALIKGINLSMTEREKRKDALSFLLLILPQCDNAILNEYGEKWFKLCAQAFYNSDRDCEKIAMLKIMTFVLRKSQELKELHTKIAKVNNSLILFLFSPKTQGALVKPALDCLYEYLTLFAGESLKYKNDIEKYVCSFLNSAIKYDSSEVESAARVFAVIPIPGANAAGSQERGKQLMQLINFGHKVLDVLFQGINETEEYEKSKEDHFIPLETLESAKLLSDPVQLCLTANLLINNAFTFISKILTSSNCSFINVSPKILLTLISRILQVEIRMVNQIAGQEMELLSCLLPSLHIKAVGLLQEIIQCKIGQSFYGIVGEQLVATLKSTNQMLKIRSQMNEKKDISETPLEFQGEFVKVVTYQTLAALIQISEGRHKLPVEIFSIIRNDIEISKDSVKLKAVKGGELNLNLKKKKKKGYSISTEDMKSDHTVTNAELSLRCPIVISALNLVNVMFLYAHHSMPRALIKGLRDTLILLLRTSLGGIYTYPEVRTSLYRATLSYARFPHPLYPMDYNSLHYALVLGCVDADPKVSQICKEGLSTISFIMENPQISRLSDISKLQNHLGISSDDVLKPDVSYENNNSNGLVSDEMEFNSDVESATSEVNSQVDIEEDSDEEDSNEEDSNEDCLEEASQICKEGLSTKPIITKNPQISRLADISRLQKHLGVSRDDILKPDVSFENKNSNGLVSDELESNSDVESATSEENSQVDNEEDSDEDRQGKKNNNVSVDEMFASFVDADPDSD